MFRPKRPFVCLAAAVLFVGLLLAGPQTRGQKLVQNTDPGQRIEWFKEHKAMEAASPFKDLNWRFIGPFDLSGRCTPG